MFPDEAAAFRNVSGWKTSAEDECAGAAPEGLAPGHVAQWERDVVLHKPWQ